MTDSIPTDTPEQKARVEKMMRMQGAKVAPMAAYLLGDRSTHVSSQVFSVRANEIFLFSQNRPIRSALRSEGWTPETIAEHLIPAFAPDFHPIDKTADVISWDPE